MGKLARLANRYSILSISRTGKQPSRLRGGRTKKLALSDLKTDVSATLAVVRAPQGLLSAIVAIALMKDGFAFSQWTMMDAPDVSRISAFWPSPRPTCSLGTLARLGVSA